MLPLEEQMQKEYFGDRADKTPQLGDTDIEKLGHFLRKLLVVNPSFRAKSSELLHDSWITEEDTSKAAAEGPSIAAEEN